MVPQPLLAAGYLALKCAAYVFWMYVGLHIVAGSATFGRALELGLGRLLLGGARGLHGHSIGDGAAQRDPWNG